MLSKTASKMQINHTSKKKHPVKEKLIYQLVKCSLVMSRPEGQGDALFHCSVDACKHEWHKSGPASIFRACSAAGIILPDAWELSITQL